MKDGYDIAIVGGGVVGLTIALILQRCFSETPLNIQLLDAGSRPAYDRNDDVRLRVSAISAGSVEIFERLGIWQSILDIRACPYRSMCVWDADSIVDSPETLHFQAAEFALPQLGFIVENALLQDVLLNELEKLQTRLCFDTPITQLIQTDSRYLLATAEENIKADLIIGADGASSALRKEADIAVSGWPYPQTAVVAHLKPEKPHQHTAWQRFLRSGPLAMLPLHDGRVSLVWSTGPDQARLAMGASDEELAAMLLDATDGVLGALEPGGPRGSFPLQAQHASRYTKPGLALIGDAAHSVHPLAGQGANLGIADAAELAAVVSEAVRGDENPGDLPVLRKYERARKGANMTMLHFVDALNRLFATDSTPVSRARGTGMRLFNKSGPIRQKAVEVALGISAR